MKLTGKHYGIILAVLVTAVLHLAAAFDKIIFTHGPDPLFILNGLGYFGLLGAYFLPISFFQQRHNLVRYTLIGYAAATILAWLIIWVGFYVIRDGYSFFDRDSIYGIPSKTAEVILIGLLWSDKG